MHCLCRGRRDSSGSEVCVVAHTRRPRHGDNARLRCRACDGERLRGARGHPCGGQSVGRTACALVRNTTLAVAIPTSNARNALEQCFLSRLAQKPRAEAPLFPQKCLKKPVQAKFLHGDRTSDSGFQRPQLARCVGACQPFTQASPPCAVADGSHLNSLEIFSAAG